jgi:methionine-rich copper-binding protein CopC
MQLKLSRPAAVLFAAVVASAYAHGIVETSTLEPGSRLSAPPSEIRLRFSEALEPTFTSVKLFGPSGQQVTTPEKAHVEDGKTVIQPLPPLPSGAYKAQWMSAGHDGHHIQGELTFTVK